MKIKASRSLNDNRHHHGNRHTSLLNRDTRSRSLKLFCRTDSLGNSFFPGKNFHQTWKFIFLICQLSRAILHYFGIFKCFKEETQQMKGGRKGENKVDDSKIMLMISHR